LGPRDFEFSILLGTGGFGSVFKAKRKTTGINYALKVQPMEAMVRSARSFGKQIEDETLVHMERTVLASCRGHPFITSLEYAFYTDSYAILGLEYVPGGTLLALISNSPGRRLPFALCKTYAIELILALNFMHRKGILYRDLKPSNILITLNGHLKLTDFGLAGSMVQRKNSDAQQITFTHSSSRQLNPNLIPEMSRSRQNDPTSSLDSILRESSDLDPAMNNHEDDDCQKEDTKTDLKWIRRRTVCGTAGYRPPEQVQERSLDYFSRNGYDERADWFSLGVCCYTMLTGRRPFPTKRELLQRRVDSSKKKFPSKADEECLDQVTDNEEYQCLMFEVQYPSYFACELDAKSWIDALLIRDPQARPRYNEIICHSWMKEVHFCADHSFQRPIPDWVKDHAYLQSIQNDKTYNLEGNVQTATRGTSRTLSDCVDDICSECFEKHDPVYAENFAIKWTTKAKARSVVLFKHWNYMSDEAIKLELETLSPTFQSEC
jgi:serine/threonine protein kinase